MRPGTRRKAATQGLAYSQVVTILLLAIGVGIVIFTYLANRRSAMPPAGGPESGRDFSTIQEKMMQELAKSENRHFSNEEVTRLKKELSPYEGETVSIECPLGEVKSCYLALELNLIFEASGWIVEEFLFATQPTPGKGLIIRANSQSGLDRAEFLTRLLGSARLTTATQLDPEQSFELRIIVPSSRAVTARKASESGAPSP